MDTPSSPILAYCSYRAPSGQEGALWPATARSGAYRRFDAVHPPRFCQRRTVAVLEIEGEGWLGTLCQEHAERFSHLGGLTQKAPKQPARTMRFRVLTPTRQPRRWTPRGG